MTASASTTHPRSVSVAVVEFVRARTSYAPPNRIPSMPPNEPL
jgi:hypothetical protein